FRHQLASSNWPGKLCGASCRRARYCSRTCAFPVVVSSNERHEAPSRTNPACQRADGESGRSLIVSASWPRRSTSPATSARRTFSTAPAAESVFPAVFFLTAAQAEDAIIVRQEVVTIRTASALYGMARFLISGRHGYF